MQHLYRKDAFFELSNVWEVIYIFFFQDGRTPLLMAIQGAHEDVVKLLLDRGAKVNIADNSKK